MRSKEHFEKMSKIRKGRKLTDTWKENISKSTTTTGYYRVYKDVSDRYKQGFIYTYSYYENGKRKKISSVDINALKDKVLFKKLPWKKLI